ncbi:site-specific DNA-methyltransferase [Corynebacterium rhinophilum]|uniref:site-specific DNA-methyltransferase n=1 Tax=Corynebacterium rhinophilum TaxID=3050197 RepID=UPI00254DFF20|nr:MULTISPECIES: site-specific DNA-methyltransferase [unclassified Corynebacterium]MDK8467424.1 site-specific DNA-methyltransferase [Corynebacterium sp. MSK130]MDK8688012.1 site-specific DNA-methyltransferase [Corynebacterium sp. MSK122]
MSNHRLELTWYNKDQALIPNEQGQYGYTWVDPTDPRYCQTHFLEYGDVVRGEQKPKEEGRTYSERADFTPADDNLLILGESGDVLETLTRVPELTDKYVGQVKCIYIDPPFNTAQTFANYEDNLEHSVWLTMMRDRLLHLKKLLSNDGSIWVHLDDVESHRMRLLMDEVFGAENFVAEVQWKKRSNLPNDVAIGSNHDTIVVYGSQSAFNLRPRPDGHGGYRNTDNDPLGPWAEHPMDSNAKGGRGVDHLFYPIVNPNTGKEYWPAKGRNWLYPREAIPGKIERGEIVFGRNGLSGPKKKTYLTNVRAGLTYPTLWLDDNFEVFPVNNAAEKEQDALFPDSEGIFETPKPERLLERIIHIATNPGDIVLDVFAGSGTTAAVAHKMGRRWVTCELNEDTFDRFTRPRLEKVVRGEDMGGITVTKGERVDATETGLPEGLSAENAQKLTSLLNKTVRDEPELKKSADLRAVKQLVKTKKTPDTINWRGGGGFTVARLSRDCFDVDEDTGLVVLTEDATARNLSAAVAAHLRFRMTPDNPVFPAKREKMNLFVTRQPLTQEFIDELVYYVPDGEAVTVAATSANPDLGRYLHKACPGSRIIHLPDGLFTRTLSTKDEA